MKENRRYKSIRKKRLTEMVVQLFLVLAFTGASFGVVTLGAKVYKKIEWYHEKQLSEYTPWTYVLMKIRQHDKKEQVRLKKIGTHTALVLGEVSEKEQYETFIYVYEGMLYEHYMLVGDPFVSGGGYPLMPLENIEWSFEDEKILNIKFEPIVGNSLYMAIDLRAGGGTDEANRAK